MVGESHDLVTLAQSFWHKLSTVLNAADALDSSFRASVPTQPVTSPAGPGKVLEEAFPATAAIELDWHSLATDIPPAGMSGSNWAGLYSVGGTAMARCEMYAGDSTMAMVGGQLPPELPLERNIQSSKPGCPSICQENPRCSHWTWLPGDIEHVGGCSIFAGASLDGAVPSGEVRGTRPSGGIQCRVLGGTGYSGIGSVNRSHILLYWGVPADYFAAACSFAGPINGWSMSTDLTDPFGKPTIFYPNPTAAKRACAANFDCTGISLAPNWGAAGDKPAFVLRAGRLLHPSSLEAGSGGKVGGLAHSLAKWSPTSYIINNSCHLRSLATPAVLMQQVSANGGNAEVPLWTSGARAPATQFSASVPAIEWHHSPAWVSFATADRPIAAAITELHTSSGKINIASCGLGNVLKRFSFSYVAPTSGEYKFALSLGVGTAAMLRRAAANPGATNNHRKSSPSPVASIARCTDAIANNGLCFNVSAAVSLTDGELIELELWRASAIQYDSVHRCAEYPPNPLDPPNSQDDSQSGQIGCNSPCAVANTASSGVCLDRASADGWRPIDPDPGDRNFSCPPCPKMAPAVTVDDTLKVAVYTPFGARTHSFQGPARNLSLVGSNSLDAADVELCRTTVPPPPPANRFDEKFVGFATEQEMLAALQPHPPTVETECTASYGSSVGDAWCCEQPGAVQNASRICPAERPICVEFQKNVSWGQCIASNHLERNAYHFSIGAIVIDSADRKTGQLTNDSSLRYRLRWPWWYVLPASYF